MHTLPERKCSGQRAWGTAMSRLGQAEDLSDWQVITAKLSLLDAILPIILLLL